MEQKLSNSDLNFIGKKFNHLTVIKKGESYISPNGHKSSQWWCECDCEEKKIILVRRNNLVNGNTKSCGCLNQEKRKENLKKAVEKCKNDLVNQQFGELIALQPTEERKNGSVVWKCLCSCGNEHYVAANDLKAHRIESCGCNLDSKGVRKIKKILNENNIPYVVEKTFFDCKFEDTNCLARFDFYIDNDFLLEYDGEQHYKESLNNYFKDSLEKRKNHDEYKNNYCKKNNIPLKRIPYTDINNISLENIMGDKYLL